MLPSDSAKQLFARDGLGSTTAGQSFGYRTDHDQVRWLVAHVDLFLDVLQPSVGVLLNCAKALARTVSKISGSFGSALAAIMLMRVSENAGSFSVS